MLIDSAVRFPNFGGYFATHWPPLNSFARLKFNLSYTETKLRRYRIVGYGVSDLRSLGNMTKERSFFFFFLNSHSSAAEWFLLH